METPLSPLRSPGSRGEQMVARAFAGLLWAAIVGLVVLATRAFA